MSYYQIMYTNNDIHKDKDRIMMGEVSDKSLAYKSSEQLRTTATLRRAKFASCVTFGTVMGIIFHETLVLNNNYINSFGLVIACLVYIVGLSVLPRFDDATQYALLTCSWVLQLLLSVSRCIGDYYSWLQITQLTQHETIPSIDYYYHEMWYYQSITYAIVAIGSVFLAMFAVIKSLPSWRALIGIILILLSAFGGLISGISEISYNGTNDNNGKVPQ